MRNGPITGSLQEGETMRDALYQAEWCHDSGCGSEERSIVDDVLDDPHGSEEEAWDAIDAAMSEAGYGDEWADSITLHREG